MSAADAAERLYGVVLSGNVVDRARDGTRRVARCTRRYLFGYVNVLA